MADDRNNEDANVANEVEMSDENQGGQGSSGDGLREFVQQRYQEQKVGKKCIIS